MQTSDSTRPSGIALVLCAFALACTDAGPSSRDTVLTAEAPATLSAYVLEEVIPLPAAKVTSGNGTPLVSAAVTFSIEEGGGRLVGAESFTDGTGRARPGRWSLGPTPGVNRLRATIGSHSVIFTATSSLRPDPLWNWKFLGAPLGEARVGSIAFDPDDPARWYVVSFERGVFVTSDSGKNWRLTLDRALVNHHGFAVHPTDARTLFAAAGRQLHVSTDRGETWSLRHTFAEFIRSIHVSASDGSLFVAPQWPAGATPGMYKSIDGGLTFQHHPYGVAAGTQVLTWHTFEVPWSGALFAGNEIADHPSPYRPPILRSLDRGITWHDVTGAVPWHVIAFGADTVARRFYALTEGAGLYVTTNGGNSWSQVVTGVGISLLVDQRRPSWLYVGQLAFGLLSGGAYASSNGGPNLTYIGLTGLTIGDLALDPSGTHLYAVAYGSGIYRAPLAATLP